MKKFLSLTLALTALIFTSGCFTARIRPGHSTVSTADTGVVANAIQPQDPKEPMTQNIVTSSTDEKVLPIGTVIDVPVPGTTNLTHVVLAAPMPVKHTDSKTIETKVGAAQKDTAQDIMAKMASVRWLQWIGIILALFGLASMFYPPLALIVGSPATSIACIAAGGALVFVPIVIVGHELLILGVAGAALAIWVFAHNHGSLTAELSALKSVFGKVEGKVETAITPAPSASVTTTTLPPQ